MNKQQRGKYMKIKIWLLLAIMIIMAAQTTVQAVAQTDANFSVSTLNASDVDCKKCHTATPHIIHAQKAAATCEKCHGDKQSVAIPQCTNCHTGTIHNVHIGKVSTQKCDYCHKTVNQVHINLTSGAVCSHCHKDLVEVHGASEACVKCHKSAPDIVKPVKSPGMILICQNCHPSTSVATIHGEIDSKQGCYNCHKGTSGMNGSDVPHNIHVNKATCQDCHQDNGKVVVPQCQKCHKINELHAFDKIGTKTSNLRCQTCHPEVKASQEVAKIQAVPTVGIATGGNVTNASKVPVSAATPGNIATPEETQDSSKIPVVPGFGIVSGIVALCLVIRKIRK
jgi:hypothetical protein